MTAKFLVGIAVIAVLIAAVFYQQSGDHLRPVGNILKVRSIAADEQRSIVVLDVRIQNDSDVAMSVGDLTVAAQAKDGRELQGTLVSASDAKQLFQYYPALGEI